MIGRLANLFRVADIRTRLWITFLFLVVYRLGMNVPIPGADMVAFKLILNERETGSTFVNFVNMLSGGSIGGVALFSLGIMPYISASIIFAAREGDPDARERREGRARRASARSTSGRAG